MHCPGCLLMLSLCVYYDLYGSNPNSFSSPRVHGYSNKLNKNCKSSSMGKRGKWRVSNINKSLLDVFHHSINAYHSNIGDELDSSRHSQERGDMCRGTISQQKAHQLSCVPPELQIWIFMLKCRRETHLRVNWVSGSIHSYLKIRSEFFRKTCLTQILCSSLLCSWQGLFVFSKVWPFS